MKNKWSCTKLLGGGSGESKNRSLGQTPIISTYPAPGDNIVSRRGGCVLPEVCCHFVILDKS